MVCEMTQLEEIKKKFLKKICLSGPHSPFLFWPPRDPPIFNISTSSDHRALILVSKVAEHQSLYFTS